MHHLAAFRAQLAISADYAAVAGAADAGLPRNPANQYIMPSPMVILAAMGLGDTLSRLQIQAPSLRNIAFPEVNPLAAIANGAAQDNVPIQIWGDMGPRLLKDESLGVAGSNSNGAAVVEAVAGLWLAPRFVPAPGGMITTLVATATLTLVADSWLLGTLAFETVLAAGRYSIVGMQAICVDANFVRLVFPGQTNLRPGVIAVEAVGDSDKYNQFRSGNMGEFGQFEFNAPPQIEVFGNTAGAEDITVFLDVVKIR